MRNDLASERRNGAPKRGWFRIPRPRTVLLAAAALFVLNVAGQWAYRRFIQSDEDKIREAIATAAQAARDRVPSGVSAFLSDDFKGPQGVDRNLAHSVLTEILFVRYHRIEVTVSPLPLPVVLDPNAKDTARAEFRAVVRGRADDQAEWEDLNPEAGGTLFKAFFKKTEQGWKMKSLEVTNK